MSSLLPRFKDANVLYHGMNVYNFMTLLDHDGKFYPNTTQRVYLDGRMRRDLDKDYDDLTHLRWCYGWSMSRCFRVSARFGQIVWVFDKDKLAHNHKIRQISWNYTIGSKDILSLDHKREKEEFICSGSVGYGPSYSDYRRLFSDEYYALCDIIDDLEYDGKEVNPKDRARLKELEDKVMLGTDEVMAMEKKRGKKITMDQAIGFYVVLSDDFYFDQDKVEIAINHEKCLGTIEKTCLFR